MSVPTPEELAPMAKHQANGDDECYHGSFDAALEAKLDALDPEWMAAMRAEYERSEMRRWYA